MKHIVVHEVGARDGLQIEQEVVPIDTKEGWIRRVMESGVDIVQVGSFVRPDRVPQMAGSDELFRRLVKGKTSPIILSGLVLNEKGVERGLECGVEMFCLGASASETHSFRNARMASREAARHVISAARLVLAEGRKVQVSVQSAFGCGYEGPVDENRVLEMVAEYLDAGLRRISLADTAGHAHPEQVERLFEAIFNLDSAVECNGHFHENRGLGVANAMAAMRVGVTSFETSFGGLGGCPFTKDPAGNLATEDLVKALQSQGRRRDIDLQRVISVGSEAAAFFEEDVPGCVYKISGARN